MPNSLDTAEREKAKQELLDFLGDNSVDPRDVLEVARIMGDINSRTGWGKIEIIHQGGEIDEIVISHRRRPKVERRAKQ
jgi:hypothetical protein